MQQRTLVYKTVAVSAVVIAANVLANYALKRGLHGVDLAYTWSPLPYIRVFSRPWVGAGVVLMFAWLTSRLALLSWADLTYVLPVVSLSYALSAVTGAIYLHENVSSLHWAGICMITVGVSLVALTYPETTEPRKRDE